MLTYIIFKLFRKLKLNFTDRWHLYYLPLKYAKIYFVFFTIARFGFCPYYGNNVFALLVVKRTTFLESKLYQKQSRKNCFFKWLKNKK